MTVKICTLDWQVIIRPPRVEENGLAGNNYKLLWEQHVIKLPFKGTRGCFITIERDEEKLVSRIPKLWLSLGPPMKIPGHFTSPPDTVTGRVVLCFS